jgi:hypothetical protein
MRFYVLILCFVARPEVVLLVGRSLLIIDYPGEWVLQVVCGQVF